MMDLQDTMEPHSLLLPARAANASFSLQKKQAVTLWFLRHEQISDRQPSDVTHIGHPM